MQLKDGKTQKFFDERLKNNPMRIINHPRETHANTSHCRICDFTTEGKNAMREAKKHARKTGHTIDVYYEVWKEITYYSCEEKTNQ